VANSKHESIFPTFFLSGFECSTFKWMDGRRRDLADETKHYDHVDEDYRILAEYGFGVAREGVPWPFVDHGDGYDFSPVEPFLQAQKKHKVLPIWDLCHYGYPDHLHPFREGFIEAFADYARAAAEHLVPRSPAPHFFTPINEQIFFGYMAGEWGWAAPFGKSRDQRYQLRRVLVEASIRGIMAIREVAPDARIVNIDPLINVVPPRDRPDLAEAARKETWDDALFAWDVLYGLKLPELGGSPDILDIVGANNYSFGQMEYRESGPHAALEPDDDRILPVKDLVQRVWDRYHRPMIIAETSGLKGGRDEWLKDMMEESLAAVRDGMDLHAICLFPLVDMPDWHTGEWVKNGFCDVVGPEMRRVPNADYAKELRRWQHLLNRVEKLDEDPLSDPVDLNEVIRAAHELKGIKADKNWY
jgi:beta-glucosidase/6-phospho-beta-glucosidase/beta-galactosidase